MTAAIVAANALDRFPAVKPRVGDDKRAAQSFIHDTTNGAAPQRTELSNSKG
jgi:hypothetical protein